MRAPFAKANAYAVLRNDRLIGFIGQGSKRKEKNDEKENRSAASGSGSVHGYDGACFCSGGRT